MKQTDILIVMKDSQFFDVKLMETEENIELHGMWFEDRLERIVELVEGQKLNVRNYCYVSYSGSKFITKSGEFKKDKFVEEILEFSLEVK